jgi:hypothetical protein
MHRLSPRALALTTAVALLASVASCSPGSSADDGGDVVDDATATPDAPTRCHDAVALTPGGPDLSGQSTAGGSAPNTACSPNEGPQRWYSLTVPAHSQVTVDADPSDAMQPPMRMRLLSACDATRCSTMTDLAMDPVGFHIANVDDAPLSFFITVASGSSDSVVTFTISTGAVMPYP